MDFTVQNHSVRGLDFPDFIFSEIKGFAFGKSCFIGRYRVNHFTGSIAERAVQRVNIFGGGDFIDRSRKTLNGIDGLIHTLGFGDRGKDLAALADFDNALLCGVFLDNLDHGNTVLVGRIVLHHIKIYGFAA